MWRARGTRGLAGSRNSNPRVRPFRILCILRRGGENAEGMEVPWATAQPSALFLVGPPCPDWWPIFAHLEHARHRVAEKQSSSVGSSYIFAPFATNFQLGWVGGFRKARERKKIKQTAADLNARYQKEPANMPPNSLKGRRDSLAKRLRPHPHRHTHAPSFSPGHGKLFPVVSARGGGVTGQIVTQRRSLADLLASGDQGSCRDGGRTGGGEVSSCR